MKNKNCFSIFSILLYLFIFSFSLTEVKLQANYEDAFAKETKSRCFVNQKSISPLSLDKEENFIELTASLSKAPTDKHLEFFHILETVDLKNGRVILEDGSVWDVGWWYTGEIKDWQAGDRLKITFVESANFNKMKIQNGDRNSTAWATVYALPDLTKTHFIAQIPHHPNTSDAYKKIILTTKLVFLNSYQLRGWFVEDEIFIFHHEQNTDRYNLWNLTRNQFFYNFKLVQPQKEQTPQTEKIVFSDLLNLEQKLNTRILAQKEATQTVAASLLNYSIGLKDPKTPIGVFLFLGPTGVGKTELAKVLTDELFKTQTHLIRFDMSHFTEPHSIARLIGSPPGYVNHEEGGQLTESLKGKPQSIVLLDEMEKAHPSVRKMFLPIFDEGYVKDSKDFRIECNDAIFIMTSNLCSSKIIELFNEGFEPEEVLQSIEPILMEHLSPELYNRVEAVLFRPLASETMDQLVEVMALDLVKRLKLTKDIDLTIDETVKEYLRINGFHPTLGARPLKKLIQKKVAANIALAIISENIPNGSNMRLSYRIQDDFWYVDWQPGICEMNE